MKVHENWMLDYFINLFVSFIRKLTQMLILTLFSGSCSILHNKNKKIYNFNAVTIKTDFRNMSENRRFRQKNRTKPSQSTHFAPFYFCFIHLTRRNIFKINRKTFSFKSYLKQYSSCF